MPSLLTSNTNECKWIQFIKPPSKCKPTWFWPNSRTWYGKPRIRPLARILETGSPIAVLLGWQPVVFHREVAHDSDSLAFWALGGSIPGGSIGIDTYDWYPIERGASKPMRPMDSYSRSSKYEQNMQKFNLSCQDVSSTVPQETSEAHFQKNNMHVFQQSVVCVPRFTSSSSKSSPQRCCIVLRLDSRSIRSASILAWFFSWSTCKFDKLSGSCGPNSG